MSATGPSAYSNSSDWKNLKVSLVLFLLLSGVLVFISLKETEPVRKFRPLQEPLIVPGSVRKTGMPKVQTVKPEIETEKLKVKTTVQMLRKDILDSAPGIYTNVRLALENDINIDEKETIEQLLEHSNLNFLEITASAESWDRLKSNQKFDLLYGTFTLLKKKYPALSENVRVAFDDNRQALDLRFEGFGDVVETG